MLELILKIIAGAVILYFLILLLVWILAWITIGFDFLFRKIFPKSWKKLKEEEAAELVRRVDLAREKGYDIFT